MDFKFLMEKIMKKLLTIFIFMTLVLSACSKDKGGDMSGSGDSDSSVELSGDYSDVVEMMTEYIEIQEHYVDGLENADNADEFVKAVTEYSENMKKILPEMKKYAEKYPDLDEGAPEDLEKLNQRAEELAERITKVTPGKMMKYASDPKVMEAMKEMAESMQGVF